MLISHYITPLPPLDASGTNETLLSMEENREALRERQEQLQKGLSELRGRLETLGNKCGCKLPNTNNLEIDADYQKVRGNIPNTRAMTD